MEWNLKFMLMNGMLILLIALLWEGKLLCRNFIFIVRIYVVGNYSVSCLSPEWLAGIWVHCEFAFRMPYANAYLWGSCSRFLWFCSWRFVYRDNIEKTNDVFLARDFSNLEYLTGSLLGWWSHFWYWMLFPCLFVCSFIYLRVALNLMSDFTFSIYWQFLTGLIIHVRFGFHDENMDKIPFLLYGTGDILSSFLLSFNKSLGCIWLHGIPAPSYIFFNGGTSGYGSYLLHRLVFVLVGRDVSWFPLWIQTSP